MNGGAYSAIGGVFEYLNSDCGYSQWSQYLIERLSSLTAHRDGIDAGCGNGYFTRALFKAGYNVMGMDLSTAMLSKAVELARKEGVSAEFLMGDITKLKRERKTGFITAVNDCFNYVPPKELFSAFLGIYRSLKKGGAFIFDISSENKLKNIVGDNTFIKDLENATVVWCNSYKGDRVETEITLFTRLSDGKYSRSDESQTQYVHREEDVVSALKKAGFSVKTEGHLGKDKSERINFLCKKL